MRRILLILIFFVAALRLNAQEVPEARYPFRRDMEKGIFDKTEERIEKKLSKDSTDVAYLYAAYQLYSATAFERYSLPRAYGCLVKAMKAYAHASAKQIDRLGRDGYDGMLFGHDLDRIGTMALNEARSTATPDAYNHFLGYYVEVPDSLLRLATYSRDSIELHIASAVGTPEALHDFLSRRPNSPLTYTAIARRDSLAFVHVQREHSVAAYERFLAQYPLSRQYRQATDSLHLIAFREAVRMDGENYYRAYADRFPESPYAVTAVYLADSIQYHQHTTPDDWHSYVAYLDAPLSHPAAWCRKALEALAQIALDTRAIEPTAQALIRTAETDSLRQPLAAQLRRSWLQPSITHYPEFYKAYGRYMLPQWHRHDSTAYAMHSRYHYHIADSCIRAIAPCHEAFLILQQLIDHSLRYRRYEEAHQLASQYAACFGDDYDYSQLMATLSAPAVVNHSTPVKALNTDRGDESSPVVTLDGETLYFAGKNRTGNIGGEDIFTARRNGKNWHKAQIHMDLSHTYAGEVPVSVSADGLQLIYLQNGRPYVASTVDRNVRQPLSDYLSLPVACRPVDAAFAPSGMAVLFTAYTTSPCYPDSSLNILVCTLDSVGHWSTPIDLGTTVNTPFDERLPMLHADMRTLYFASEGHGSLGQMDIFRTTRLDDTWTRWSTPVNVGKEINTVENDTWLQVTASGNTAYTFSRGRSLDLYQLEMPEAMRPGAVTILSGSVRLSPMRSTTLRYEDLETGKSLGIVHTHPVTGQYSMALPSGRLYGIYVDDTALYPQAFHIDLRILQSATQTQHNFYPQQVRQLAEGDYSIALENIFFQKDSTTLNVASMPELLRLVRLMHMHNVGVALAPTANPETSDSATVALCTQRANNIQQTLISMGAPAERTIVTTFDAIPPATRKAVRKKKSVEVLLLP